MGAEPVSGKRYFDMLSDNAEAWQSAWNTVVGEGTVIRTSPRWDGMVKHLGYASQSVVFGVSKALQTVITSDKDLVEQSQESLRLVKVVPDAQLTQRAETHLKLARAIASSYDPGGIKVHAAIIPPASDRVRTAGLYDMGTREIMLHLSTLEKAHTTVDAMVHELGHHIAFLRTDDPLKAEDLQPAHSEAMTYIAARVFQATIDGDFDKYVKEAVW